MPEYSSDHQMVKVFTETLKKADSLGKLSNTGTKLTQAIEEAVKRAEELKKAAEKISPITRVALDWESGDKVAQQLSRALSSAIHHDSIEVRVTYDMARNWYVIQTFDHRLLRQPNDQVFHAAEEVLVANTQSVELFHRWVDCCAIRIRDILNGYGDERRLREELNSFGMCSDVPQVTAAEEQQAIESIRREINARRNGASQ